MVDRSVAVRRKAQQLLQKGDVNGGLAEYEKLFEGGDKDPYDFIVVADLLAKRGSMQEAVRRYRQAIEEYAKTELYKNAIAVCKKILRISKEDLAIHRTLGELYAKEGLFGDAQIHYLEFAEGSIRRQDHDAALGVLDEVLKLSPDNDDLSEKYVEIAMRADQPERGGRELLRRAERVKQSGRHDEAEQIRERVSTLAPALLNSFHAAPVSPQGPVAAADAAATMEAPPGGHAGFDPSSRALGYDAPTQDEAAVEEPPPPAAVEPEPELDPKNDRPRSRINRLDTNLSGEPGGGPVDLDALPDDRPAASVRVREDEPQSQDALIDLEEIIDEFKAGVSERISGEDHESHYDLGMAYMEMGLYDDAIGEFQLSSKGAR